MASTFRLQLQLDQASKERLTEVQALAKEQSFVGVIRRAIALFDLVLEHKASGGSLVFRKADGTEEVLRLL